MGKGNHMLSVIFISFTMICTSSIIGLFHKVLSLYAIVLVYVALALSAIAILMLMSEHPSRESIWSAIWEKATRCLWFSFAFVQDDLQCLTNHRVVPAITFSTRHWGALIISTSVVRYYSVDVDVRTPIKRVFLMRHIATIWEKATGILSDFYFLSLRVISNGRPIVGLFHQALSLYYFAVPLDHSIGSFRDCRAGVNFTTPIKGVYFMTQRAAIMEKGSKMSVIFIFCRSAWPAMLDKSLVFSTKHFFYTLLGCFTYQHWLYLLLQCWCWNQIIHERNVLEEVYSNHMGKSNKILSVIFIVVRSGWRAMLGQSLVYPTKQALSLYAIGLLYFLVWSLSAMTMLILMSEHTSRECTWWDIHQQYEKRQPDIVCDFHFLLFRMICNGRPIIGLFTQAHIRYCSSFRS